MSHSTRRRLAAALSSAALAATTIGFAASPADAAKPATVKADNYTQNHGVPQCGDFDAIGQHFKPNTGYYVTLGDNGDSDWVTTNGNGRFETELYVDCDSDTGPILITVLGQKPAFVLGTVNVTPGDYDPCVNVSLVICSL